MNEKQVSDLLAGLLENQEKEHDLMEKLTGNPEPGAEVAELVDLARELSSMPVVAPSAAFRSQARRRLLSRLQPHLSWRQRLSHRFQETAAVIGAVLLPRKQAVVWLFALLLFFIAGGGAVYSAEAALPGEPLYPVKTSTENLRLSWARDEIQVGQLHLLFAARRAGEIARMAAQGRPEPINETAHHYVRHVAAVHDTVQKYDGAGELVSDFHENMSAQELALAQVSAMAPPAAQPGLDRAMAATTESRVAAQELIVAAAPEITTKTDLRLGYAGERLAAAANFLALGYLELADSAMNEYSSQVDEVVSLVASSEAPVQAELAGLLAQRLAIHDGVLSQVEERAPEAALPGIQRARAASAHGRNVVNAIMEARSHPGYTPVVPADQTGPPARPTPAGPPAHVTTGPPGLSQTPAPAASGGAGTPPDGGGPPIWVTVGPPGQDSPGQGNQGQGPSKGKQGKHKGNRDRPVLDGDYDGQGALEAGDQGQGSQGQGNQGQGQGNQGQGQGNQGNQGNQGPGQGNQGNQGQGQGNQGQGQGQGNQGKGQGQGNQGQGQGNPGNPSDPP
jgi:hypothetical protein